MLLSINGGKFRDFLSERSPGALPDGYGHGGLSELGEDLTRTQQTYALLLRLAYAHRERERPYIKHEHFERIQGWRRFVSNPGSRRTRFYDIVGNIRGKFLEAHKSGRRYTDSVTVEISPPNEHEEILEWLLCKEGTISAVGGMEPTGNGADDALFDTPTSPSPSVIVSEERTSASTDQPEPPSSGPSRSSISSEAPEHPTETTVSTSVNSGASQRPRSVKTTLSFLHTWWFLLSIALIALLVGNTWYRSYFNSKQAGAAKPVVIVESFLCSSAISKLSSKDPSSAKAASDIMDAASPEEREGCFWRQLDVSNNASIERVAFALLIMRDKISGDLFWDMARTYLQLMNDRASRIYSASWSFPPGPDNGPEPRPTVLNMEVLQSLRKEIADLDKWAFVIPVPTGRAGGHGQGWNPRVTPEEQPVQLVGQLKDWAEIRDALQRQAVLQREVQFYGLLGRTYITVRNWALAYANASNIGFMPEYYKGKKVGERFCTPHDELDKKSCPFCLLGLASERPWGNRRGVCVWRCTDCTEDKAGFRFPTWNPRYAEPNP
jgi:hypothetical protein